MRSAINFGFQKFATTVIAATLLTYPIASFSATKQAVPIHIGYSTKVEKKVLGQIPGREQHTVLKAEKIFHNENVITSGNSTLVVQFRDGSTFELGPNGAMTLDDMVFNPYESVNTKVINIAQGTFRYISGFKAKESQVTLKTPIGTIGIRGSSASGVAGAGSTSLLMTSGQGTFTPANAPSDTEPTPLNTGDALVGSDDGFASGSDLEPAIVAEVASTVENVVGPASSQAVTLTPEQQAENAAVNRSPTAAQTNVGQSTAIDPALLPPSPVPATLATASATISNPASLAAQALVAAVRQAHPNAAQTVQNYTASSQVANTANTQTGTQDVITGEAANADNAAQVGALVQAAVGANPEVVEVISRSAVSGGNTNSTIGDITQVAQQVGKGAVAGATQSGADIATVTQAAAKGTIAGAVEAGADINAVTKSATQGAISGAAETGADIGSVTRSATAGAIVGAAETGADVNAVTQAATAGAISGASEVGADVAVVTQVVTQTAIQTAVETGTDIVAITQSVTSAAITTAQETGVDIASLSAVITNTAIETATEMEADVTTLTQAVADTALTSTQETTPTDSTDTPTFVDEDDPAPESELQNGSEN